MPLRGKSLTFSGHSKASKLSVSFPVRRSLARKSFFVLLILSQLCKQRSSLILCKDIDSIEMIFWDCNFLTRPSTTSIKTTKVVIFPIFKVIQTAKIIKILEEIIFTLPKTRLQLILAQQASLQVAQHPVHKAPKIIKVALLVTTIKIVLPKHYKSKLIHHLNLNIILRKTWLLVNLALFQLCHVRTKPMKHLLSLDSLKINIQLCYLTSKFHNMIKSQLSLKPKNSQISRMSRISKILNRKTDLIVMVIVVKMQ